MSRDRTFQLRVLRRNVERADERAGRWLIETIRAETRSEKIEFFYLFMEGRRIADRAAERLAEVQGAPGQH